MMIKNIHIIRPQAPQALLERGEQIFARTPIAVRSGPHKVAGFRGDDKFVTVRSEIGA